MHKSKVLVAYGALTNKEQIEFKQFVHLHSKSKPLSKLHDLLFKYRKDLISTKLDKEAAFKKVFPTEKTFNSKKLRVAQSDLFKLFENFAIQKELEYDPFKRSSVLGSFFERRYVKKLILSQHFNSLDTLNAAPHRGVNYYSRLLDIEKKLTYAHGIRAKNAQEMESKAYETLELFYAASKLTFATETYVHNYLAREPEEHFDLNLLLSGIKKDKISNTPYVNIYKNLIQALRENNLDGFNHVFGVVQEFHASFTRIELNSMLTGLVNLRIKIYRSQDIKKLKSYHKDTYSIYKFGIEQNVWHLHGFLPVPHFLNIIGLGCNNEDFQYLEAFLNDPTLKFAEDSNESIIQYGKGKVAFAQGHFEDCLGMLRDVELSDPYVATEAKTLQLQSFYELPGFGLAMDNFIKAFDVYLKRNKKVLPVHAERYKNLLNFTRRLYKYKQVNEKPPLELSEKIDNSQVMHGSWLKSKMAELQRKGR